MTTVSLFWPQFELFPYERKLALAEAEALLAPQRLEARPTSVVLESASASAARRLTYFRAYQSDRGAEILPTLQHQIETETSGGIRRQSTRYSVHGMHEYKGKFNPQVVRALLNGAGLSVGARVVDPFCGSGTSLIECAHAGMNAVGVDINPLAAVIANAKATALASTPDALVEGATAAVSAAARSRAPTLEDGERADYLRHWFDARTLSRLEALRLRINELDDRVAQVLRVIASNRLREFSLQEPADLRIRRRKSPPSARDLHEVFLDDVQSLAANLRVVRRHLRLAPHVHALCGDLRTLPDLRSPGGRAKFDAAITSPPYAMALPYIDTQRLSLVWLDLIDPRRLGLLQATLIGSREFNGSPRNTWDQRLASNSDHLPPSHARLCRRMCDMLGSADGFRRRAVPSLLYRYLAGMRESFRAVRSLLKTGAPFYLIVGHNHTVLGGKRVDIPTPELLGELAETEGFAISGAEMLETYPRYGLHQKNAIDAEELLTLRAA